MTVDNELIIKCGDNESQRVSVHYCIPAVTGHEVQNVNKGWFTSMTRDGAVS